MVERKYSPAALLVFGLGLAAVLATVLSGLGVRWGLWEFRTGFTLLRISAWTGLGVAALAVIACFVITAPPMRRGLGLAAIGLVCGVLAFAVPASYLDRARSVPRLHDVTTDTRDPPQLVAVLPLREKAKARNPAAYDSALAAVQANGYPDIRPLIVPSPAKAAFDAALALAVERGWEIVAVAPQQGRIEATAITFWYGFRDDIVIRVTAEQGMTRIDMRSVSRVGRNDVGANAARIRAYLAELERRLTRS